jgi:signal transduction histidine kinase
MQNNQKEQTKLLERVRKRILWRLLKIIAILSLPAIIIAEIEAYYLGQIFGMFVYPVAYLLILTAAIFRKRLTYNLTASLLLFALFIIACFNIYIYGFSGAGIPLFIAMFVLSTVFLGMRAGFIVICLSTLPILVFGYMMVNGYLLPGVDFYVLLKAPIAWITALSTVIVIGIMLVITNGVIQGRLVESYKEISKQKEKLQHINLRLEADIQKRIEIEKELTIAKEKAEESDRLKTSFLMNMSHEIRTPMNGILGFSSLLEDPELTSDDRHAYIEMINKSGKRMMNTINMLIDIAKIESRQAEIYVEEIDIDKCLDELLATFKPFSQEKGISLLKQLLTSDKELVIKSDEYKVMQTFSNLIENAIKFTKEGEVIFGCIPNEKNIHFFVEDTGIGIDKKHHDMIFERFRQVNIELNSGYEGSGVGLSISKAYVEMLGGKILLESQPGKGSRFEVVLPKYFKDNNDS